jgi:hypothetical protein
MVAVTVLISTYSETRNNQLLLGDNRALREALRKNFKDLRLHTTVWKFIWEFVDDLEAIRGAVNGSTVNRNPSKRPARPTASSATMTITAPAASSKLIVQRGTKAAKTGSAPVIPPLKKVAVKKEKASPTPSSDLPSPKRQRTDAGPSTQVLTVDLPNGSVPSSQMTNGKVAFQEHRPWMQPAMQTSVPPTTSAYQSPFSPTSVSPMIPNTATLPQRNATPGQLPSKHPTYSANMPPRTASLSGSGRAAGPLHQDQAFHPTSPLTMGRQFPFNPPPNAPHTPEVTPLPTSSRSPPHIQHNPISEPDGYRAPTAPMQPSAQLSSSFWLAPKAEEHHASDTSPV